MQLAFAGKHCSYCYCYCVLSLSMCSHCLLAITNDSSSLVAHQQQLLHSICLKAHKSSADLRVDSDACLQVRKSFGLDHETITQLAEKEAAGSSGVNFLPYITGERTPNWPHSSGVLMGLRPGSMRPGLLYRAAMEGATFSLLAGQQHP